MSARAAALAAVFALGCGAESGGDAPPGTGAAEVGQTCAERAQALVDQCPPGSNPQLNASATDVCAGQIDVELEDRTGAVTGVCRGGGGCLVVCNFVDPCPCGIDRVSRDELVCTACADAASCGDGVCESPETPATCPEDCADACVAGAQRCSGEAREVCEADGDWGPVACRSDQACAEIPNANLTYCETRVSPSGGTWVDPGALADTSDGPADGIRFRQAVIGCGGRCAGLRFLDGGAAALLREGSSLKRYAFDDATATDVGFSVSEYFAVTETHLATSARQPKVVDLLRRTSFTADAIVDDTTVVAPEAVALTGDGALLAVAMGVYAAPLVALWETTKGEARHLLRFVDAAVATNAPATALAFSPNGALLAEGRADGIVVIWNVAEGRYVHLLRTDRRPIQAFAWHPSGDGRLLIGAGDGLALWDAKTPAQRWSLPREGAESLAFAPDGGVFAASSGSATLRRTDTGQVITAIDEGGRVDFSADGHRLLVGTAVYADAF